MCAHRAVFYVIFYFGKRVFVCIKLLACKICEFVLVAAVIEIAEEPQLTHSCKADTLNAEQIVGLSLVFVIAQTVALTSRRYAVAPAVAGTAFAVFGKVCADRVILKRGRQGKCEASELKGGQNKSTGQYDRRRKYEYL